PFDFIVPAGTVAAGPVTIKGIAKDRAGNMKATSEIHATVKKIGESAGDLGRSCVMNSDCNGGGFCSIEMGGTRQCSLKCSTTSPCPTSFACEAGADFTQHCVNVKKDEGCSALPG